MFRVPAALGRWPVGLAVIWLVAGPAELQAASEPFGPTTVVDLARQLAKSAYVPPAKRLPPSIDDLSYDDYQAIQFRRELALGRAEGLPLWVELVHRGLLYEDRVDVAVVHDRVAEAIPYAT